MTFVITRSTQEISETQNVSRSFSSTLQVSPTVEIGEVRFDAVTMESAVESIAVMAQSIDKPRYICTGNLDHLAMLRHDAEFREIYSQADMILADGMPIVWLSRLRRRRNQSLHVLPERVAGSDLFFELGGISAEKGLRLFYLGGAPGSAEKAARIIEQQYSGANVCGTYCPPFETFGTPAEEAKIESMIHAARPDILLVGLGAPKQEKWIATHLQRLNVPVSIGVGASFEMACGMVRRAPLWMQKCGMEWSYRLMQEPGRLWKRYMGRDLPYLCRLLFQTIVAK